MSIYHCSIKSISRGAGQSAVAAAAYRHACKLENTRTGELHDYTRKQGLESSKIYLPSGVNAEWATNREQLWNAVESAEKRVNSRLGRDVVLALPSELSAVQRRELAGEMARHLADRYGVVVDVAIHQPSRDGDQRNHHSHMLMSSRRITAQGFGEKARELDDKERGPVEVEHIREAWETMANRALEMAGQDIKIDHRSLQAQGIKRFPTLHLGPSASAMERRGIKTRLGEYNKACASVDAEVCRFEELGKWQSAEKQAQEAPKAREWIRRREELRQKEKMAENGAEKFFEDATNYDGARGLAEAQKEYQAIPLWQRILLDKEKTIQAQAKAFQEFSADCRKKGEKSRQLAQAYAEQGFQIALAHPEARDNDDKIALARMAKLHEENERQERQRQAESQRKLAHEALEASGYRGELNRLAEGVWPQKTWIDKQREDWKKPYLELIRKNDEERSVVDWCLSRARHDASPEGQAELKEIKSLLEKSLKSTGWSLSKQWDIINPAMDKIRVHQSRPIAVSEVLQELQQKVGNERSRGRGR